MINAVTYTIRNGETIRSIAYSQLGDTNLWPTIVAYNKLDYPFIIGLYDDSPSTQSLNIKRPGDQILIPKEDTTPLISDADSSIETSLFGCDLALQDSNEMSPSNYGEIDLAIDLQTGDYAVFKGIQSLKQDLMHGLCTEYSTMPYHPEWGSNFLTIVGSKGDEDWRNKAIIEICKTFKSDSRVEDVIDVTITSLPQGVRLNCKVVVVGGNIYPFSYTV
ncbi:MAG: hypothetical protein Q8910_00875 [Bacteroidota bacterium]|nr:hypothetical protein [Bacteroidota bacterium]